MKNLSSHSSLGLPSSRFSLSHAASLALAMQTTIQRLKLFKSLGLLPLNLIKSTKVRMNYPDTTELFWQPFKKI